MGGRRAAGERVAERAARAVAAREVAEMEVAALGAVWGVERAAARAEERVAVARAAVERVEV